ncbi:copper resistance system multicopper oxidase [Litorimonas sp.]|uniref:copper resistance system multicopper oxidase n=1 Tax=Litorimonas sp. TaxID=1892381 RepID=UPI003A86B729
MFDRRKFLTTTIGAGAALGASSLMPAWAKPASAGNLGIPGLQGSVFDLNIGKFPHTVGGKTGTATGINGTVPGPLIRFREGDDITLNVKNTLDEDTSIHWHGLLVPFQMDGVPGVTFPGIKPGTTFTYKYSVPQSGTYWYHSHSGLQEQAGHYGPIIIDPKGADPVQYDREYVLVLSDWSFKSPHQIFTELMKNPEAQKFQNRTLQDFADTADEVGLVEAFKRRSMWGGMRMSSRDISDVTGATYTFLINGHSTLDNWNAVFAPGERVRLRVINASAMTIFNFRIPGLPMSVVAADGLNVRPVETDEFQIGVAETYDVVVAPEDARAYALTAESIDRSGQAIATLGPKPGMRAKAPTMREIPELTMKDMGMASMMMGGMMDEPDMKGMDHGNMNHAKMGHNKMDHESRQSSEMEMGGMTESGMAMSGMDHGDMDMMAKNHDHANGPGVTFNAQNPISRLHEPGTGLENVPHRVLRYTDLKSLTPNKDLRAPEREMEIHLTSNMERYMFSFDGIQFAYVKDAIKFYEGERLRVTLVNDTMMNHPIHLHGMFFEVVDPDVDVYQGGPNHQVQKHTILVMPGSKVSLDISAEHVGDWAFHCHLLYHMHAGMMHVVSLLPKEAGRPKSVAEAVQDVEPKPDHSQMDHAKMGEMQ